MALAAFNGQAQDLAGNAVAGVKVELRRESDNTLPSLFSDRDGVVPLGNPYTTPALDNGRFRFHVIGGVYRLRLFTDAGFEVVWRYVAIQELIALLPGAVTDGHAVVWNGATGLELKSLGKHPFFSRFVGLSVTPITLPAADAGTFFVNFGADRAVTLPAPAPGIALGFYSLTGNLTVNLNGGSLLFENGSSEGGSIVLASNDRMIIIADGANWIVFASSLRRSKATPAQVRSAAPDRAVTTDLIESASAIAVLADAATVAVDWDAGINFFVELAGNRVLGNPSNGQIGTWRTLRVAGNNATLRVLTFGSQYTGALPTLVDISSAKQYLLSIYCYGPSQFMLKSTVLFP